MKHKLALLLLILMLMVVSVPSAFSYFFTYTTVKGTVAVELDADDSSEINETADNTTKDVVITADDGSSPIFVRVKVFYVKDDVTVDPIKGENWSALWLEGDDIYHYLTPIDGVADSSFGDTAAISFRIAIASGEADDTKHVVVVYEATPALFSETEPTSAPYSCEEKNGDETVGYWYPDWSTTFVAEQIDVNAVTEGD